MLPTPTANINSMSAQQQPSAGETVAHAQAEGVTRVPSLRQFCMTNATGRPAHGQAARFNELN